MKLWTRELVKKYKHRTVVNRVSMEVNRGEIVGLLGPNGAGKTTNFYMIVGLIKPFQGKYFLMTQRLLMSQCTSVHNVALGILHRKLLFFGT